MSTLREALMLKEGGVISLVGAGGKTSLMRALTAELARSGDPVLATTTTKIRRSDASVQSSVVIVDGDLQAVIARCRQAVAHHPLVTAAAGNLELQNKLIGFPQQAIREIWRCELFRWIVVEADGAGRKPLKAPAEHEPVVPAVSQWVIGLVGLSAVGKPFSDHWVFRPGYFQQISGLSLGETISSTATVKVLLHPLGIFKGAPQRAKKLAFLNQADTLERLANGRDIAESLSEIPSNIDRVVIGQLQEDSSVIEYLTLG